MSAVENIILFHSVLDEALERLGKKNLKLKECQYEAVKAVVVDRKDTICILPSGYGNSLIYHAASSLRLIESIYFQRMHSTGDTQFFVRRSRIIPEPPFPSQGIAGSGNEIECYKGLIPRQGNSSREAVYAKYGWLGTTDSFQFSHFFRFRSE